MKVINKRPAGFLFHYGHFIMDCVFPEILAGVPRHKKIYRLDIQRQTIGNFHELYERLMGVQNIEILAKEFKELRQPLKIIKRITNPSIEQIKYYRQFIFGRFSIPAAPKSKFPSIILIKRGCKPLLSNKQYTAMRPGKLTHLTGKQRREIKQIDLLERWLRQRYGINVKTLVLEDIPYRAQIMYFKNAKYIIGIHGAALANMLYCSPGTKLIEVNDGMRDWNWRFINNSMQKLGITRIRCDNDLQLVKKTIAVNIPK